MNKKYVDTNRHEGYHGISNISARKQHNTED